MYWVNHTSYSTIVLSVFARPSGELSLNTFTKHFRKSFAPPPSEASRKKAPRKKLGVAGAGDAAVNAHEETNDMKRHEKKFSIFLYTCISITYIYIYINIYKCMNLFLLLFSYFINIYFHIHTYIYIYNYVCIELITLRIALLF